MSREVAMGRYRVFGEVDSGRASAEEGLPRGERLSWVEGWPRVRGYLGWKDFFRWSEGLPWV